MKHKSPAAEDVNHVVGILGLKYRQWLRHSHAVAWLRSGLSKIARRLVGQMQQPCSSSCGSDTYLVACTTIILIPEFGHVEVQSQDEHQFTITRRTPGVLWSELEVGDRLLCCVTRRLPRLLWVLRLDTASGVANPTGKFQTCCGCARLFHCVAIRDESQA